MYVNITKFPDIKTLRLKSTLGSVQVWFWERRLLVGRIDDRQSRRMEVVMRLWRIERRDVNEWKPVIINMLKKITSA